MARGASRRVRTDEGRLGDDRGRVRDRGDGRRGARMDPGRHELQRIQVRRRVRRSHRRGARGRHAAPARDGTRPSVVVVVVVVRDPANGTRDARRDGILRPHREAVARIPSRAPRPPLANGHGDYVLCVSFGPDARTLFTGGADGRICVWDCDDAAAGNPAPAACLRPGSNAAVRSVDASLPPPSEDEPGDVLSMTGGEDGTLRVFSHASNGGAVCEVVFAGHGGAVTCLALCRGEERGWGSPPRARKEEGSGTRRIRIAAGHDGGVLSVHDAALTSGPPGDGNAPGTVRASAKVREVFVGRVHANGAARATLLLRPDARTVASASEDRTVRLWNMQKGNCLCVLVGARCTVESVSFSALGDLLYAGLADGHVWVYLEERGEEDDVASGDGVERVIESRLALAMEALRDPKDPRASSTSESERCASGAAPSARRFQDAYEEMESDALGLLPGVDRSNVALVGEVAGGSSGGGGSRGACGVTPCWRVRCAGVTWSWGSRTRGGLAGAAALRARVSRAVVSGTVVEAQPGVSAVQGERVGVG